MYVLNGRYNCTEPIRFYKHRPPRKPLDIVKFSILDNITADELDSLASEDLIFIDTETDTVTQFPGYRISGRAEIKYAHKTQIILERQVLKNESNIRESSN